VSGRVWTVVLPSMTAPPLRENDRLHWAKKARITGEIRDLAFVSVRIARVPRLERAAITMHWQPAVRRVRDQNGHSPSLKAAVDGCVDAGVLADDDSTRCVPACALHDPVRGEPGRVWLTIQEELA
jgi:crossover junction endodeoxyribonuclease RusA